MPYEVKYIDLIKKASVAQSPGTASLPEPAWAGAGADFVTPANGTTGWISANGAHLLAGLPRGTSEHERLGRKIKVLSLEYTAEIKMKIQPVTKGTPYFVQPSTDLAFYVVYDKQNNNSNSTKESDIWVNNAAYDKAISVNNTAGAVINYPLRSHQYVRRSLDENHRFRILKKFKTSIPKVPGGTVVAESPEFTLKTIKFYVPINKVFTWDADINPPAPGVYDGSTMPNGTLGIYTLGPENFSATFDSVPNWVLSHQSMRIRFIDL